MRETEVSNAFANEIVDRIDIVPLESSTDDINKDEYTVPGLYFDYDNSNQWNTFDPPEEEFAESVTTEESTKDLGFTFSDLLDTIEDSKDYVYGE